MSQADGTADAPPLSEAPARFRPLASLDEPVPGGDWEPRSEEPETAFPVPWRWWDALVIYVISGFLTYLGIRALAPLVGTDTEIGVFTIVAGTALIVVTLGWILKRGRHNVWRLAGPVRASFKDVAVGVGGGLGAFAVINLGLLQLLDLTVRRSGGELPPIQEELQDAFNDPALVPLILVGVVLLAPLGEELLFRGVLFQALRRRVPPWPAIGLSGLAFGLTHVQPVAIVGTFPLGMYLAWLFHRRGTIVSPIVAHLVFNLLGAVLLIASDV